MYRKDRRESMCAREKERETHTHTDGEGVKKREGEASTSASSPMLAQCLELERCVCVPKCGRAAVWRFCRFKLYRSLWQHEPWKWRE